MKKEKDWFRLKKYPHIGLPLKAIDRPWVTAYITTEAKVAAHAFYPLIHRSKVVRKYRKKVDKETGARSVLRYASSKPRQLYYANHLDACIYGYYAKNLNAAYEEKLNKFGLNNAVTAYRRIAVRPGNPKSVNKSSADFAAEVFQYILDHEEDDLVAITFDIKGFFDTLEHGRLKKAWYEINDSKTLTEAEYNIFKSLTDFAFVNENEIFEHFKAQILTETPSGIQKIKPIKRFKHLKDSHAIAYCDLNGVKSLRNANLIVGNNAVSGYYKRGIGIPQGTPMSAVLANVYMLPFDYSINETVRKIRGLYRRYSDDMIVVCSEKHCADILLAFETAIAERKLEIQHDKTQIFKFSREGGRFRCSQVYDKGIHLTKNLEYLGFEFDGEHTFLKSASLASYYRKMKRAVQRSRYYSKSVKHSKSVGQLFQTRLYKKYTYLGAKRRRIYVQDKKDPSNWIKTETHNWGNYISYAHLAANKLPNNKIRGQVRRHWVILNKLIN
ncbi:reverse transcriptase domain-containing protein [Mucilaginibacter lacusdianchii]|uniref:reverse transcriptase domain-containing protein n=1 Tax=Mucilaginibacter lacusdianchii TaxID=2684211 RepID=UPI00131D80C1|nr:reverse transcriptase domain-containing protein [Mucilaginibacter sp. JXJ CY 39]